MASVFRAVRNPLKVGRFLEIFETSHLCTEAIEYNLGHPRKMGCEIVPNRQLGVLFLLNFCVRMGVPWARNGYITVIRACCNIIIKRISRALYYIY